MWGNRKDEDLPAELKGKTPEQVAQELKDAQVLKTRLDALEAKNTERDTMFQSFSTTQGELVNTLKAVNERITTPVRTTPVVDNEPASFITDPDLAFNQRIGPLAAVTMQIGATAAKQEALAALRRKQSTEKNNIDGSLFERFESEILEQAKNCTPAQLANPATWAHLFYNVKGRHTDEIVQNPSAFFTEQVTRTAHDDTQPGDKLTDQELAIATKMGVKPENYLKNRKAATVNPF